MLPRKKQGWWRKPVLTGILSDVFLGASDAGNTKRPDVVFAKKSHAAEPADKVEEPESGRMVQSQMINLVNGVVTRSLAATDATNDRVGACGTKLLNGFNRTPVAGRPTASLPVRPQSTNAARTWQARWFLSRKGPPAGGWSAPEELEQFLSSLLRRRGGWFANHALPSNPAIASLLQSARLVAAIAELGS